MQDLPLKDKLLNRQRVVKLADDIRRVYPVFASEEFVCTVLDAFPQLELKARIAWISEALRKFLPNDYPEAVAILLASLPAPDDTTYEHSDFGIFIYAPYSDFVAKYGCTKEQLRLSLQALKAMTIHYSAEDAIRYFINAYPEETMAELLKWSLDDDYRVRRLASEGTRPILPWSPKIHTSVEAALPILDNLFTDNNRFVTRSVANHLNDISRTQPDLAIATLRRWQASGKQTAKEMKFITNQALRTLIKTGYPPVFEFLGVATEPKVVVEGLRITNKNNPIRIGERLEFALTLSTQADERLIIDYTLHFPNKAGNGHNRKVFKLKTLMVAKGQQLTIVKAQPMRQMTTRRLYPGHCRLTVQVNGKQMAEVVFELETGER